MVPRTRMLCSLWLCTTICSCGLDELREDEVGDAAACEAARRWPADAAVREDVLFDLVNDARAAGGRCADSNRNPVAAVVMSPELRCAARLHATFISERGELTHEGTDGSTTLSRINLAEYRGVPKHEVLAADFDDPSEVLDRWLESGAHCSAILDPRVVDVGIGHVQTVDGDGAGWVLLTGEAR